MTEIYSANPPNHHRVWSMAFYVCTSFIAVFGLCGFISAAHSASFTTNISTQSVLFAFGSFTFAAFTSLIVYFLLKRFSGPAIKVACFSMFALSMLAAISSFAIDAFSGVMATFCTASFGFYLYWNWHRVQFAGECLRISMKTLENNNGLLWITLGFVGLMMAWSFACGMASYALSSFVGDSDDSWVQVIFFVPTFTWGAMVLSWMLYCIGSGTMGRVLLTDDPNPVKSSIYHVFGAGMGPICLLAFVFTLVRCLRFLSNTTRERNTRQGNNFASCFFCMLTTLLQALEVFMKYLSEFGLIFCTMYGCDVLEGGERVGELFERSGFNAVINEDFLSMPFNLAKSLLAIVNGMFSGYFGKSFGMDPTVSAAVGAIFALGVSNLMFAPLPVLSRTLFVAWVSEKNLLQKKSPEVSGALHQALTSFGYSTA